MTYTVGRTCRLHGCLYSQIVAFCWSRCRIRSGLGSQADTHARARVSLLLCSLAASIASLKVEDLADHMGGCVLPNPLARLTSKTLLSLPAQRAPSNRWLSSCCCTSPLLETSSIPTRASSRLEAPRSPCRPKIRTLAP